MPRTALRFLFRLSDSRLIARQNRKGNPKYPPGTSVRDACPPRARRFEPNTLAYISYLHAFSTTNRLRCSSSRKTVSKHLLRPSALHPSGKLTSMQGTISSSRTLRSGLCSSTWPCGYTKSVSTPCGASTSSRGSYVPVPIHLTCTLEH